MDASLVSQRIKTLRRALDPPSNGVRHIETVSRSGYRLAVDVAEEGEPEMDRR